VDFADKILELLDDSARREWMGRYGKERVENSLAWEYSERVLRRAYEALFAKVDGE
jgi:glycosyltransferase involved in cell wall biosynthesis